MSKSDKTPQLRAVAVLEWTGEAGKPKACRIVPITIYDGEQLQDGGLYLARPEPLALAGEVEYELKQDGKTFGIFDVKNSGQEEGSWVGYGEWKDVPAPKTDTAPPKKIADDEGDPDDDKPILHRKHDEASTADSKSGTTTDDADRPKLQKKTDGSADSSSDDSGHPKLHKKTEDSASDTAENSSGSAPIDPDRPVMKEPKKKHGKAPEDESGVSSVATTDPDRPRLKHGMSNADSLRVLPSLLGLPPDMQQAVAVSDAQNRPDHVWTYTWANPGDEAKMKSQLEDLARQALGIAAPAPAAAPTPAAKSAVSRRSAAGKKAAQPATPPPPPAILEDEQFRVFELAYGSGATMVLTAHTPGPLAHEKFVTLIAQPDLYGNVRVLLTNTTDGAHLDDTPWMRLVDAVDVMADNRGELLFELRGETSREFAVYRILRGRADKLFVSFAGNFGVPTTD